MLGNFHPPCSLIQRVNTLVASNGPRHLMLQNRLVRRFLDDCSTRTFCHRCAPEFRTRHRLSERSGRKTTRTGPAFEWGTCLLAPLHPPRNPEGLPTDSGADQLPQATCLCLQARQPSHTRPRKAFHRSVHRLSGYEMVCGCWGASSFRTLNIADIGLPFVSGLDGRLGPTWVPMGVPQQENFPLRPQIFRQGAARKLSPGTHSLLAAHRPVRTVVVQLLRPVGVMKMFSSVGASRRLRESTLFCADPIVASTGTFAASSPNGDAVSRTNATGRESKLPLPLPCRRNHMKTPLRLDFTPTPPCTETSEQNICEHNE